jgi:hypothetical protein
MRTLPFIVAMLILAAACNRQAGPKPSITPAAACSAPERASEALAQGDQVMAGITMDSSTPIGDIAKDPQRFHDQTVRVEGVITTICQKAGCFVALQDAEGHSVNLKVVDGEVDFRKLAQNGAYAVGEGTFMSRGPHGSQVQITGAMIGHTTCQ